MSLNRVLNIIIASLLFLNVYIVADVIFDKTKVYARTVTTYTSPEGIQFISLSKYWDENKLKTLYYNELLQNTHGKELKDLSKVIIHHEPKKKNSISGEYYISSKEIHLYNGKERRTPASLGNTLTHEYGHHVQYTYFPKLDFGKDEKWIELRDLEGKPYVKGYSGNGKHPHRWYLDEIFAEDYSILFGKTRPLKEDDYPHYNVIFNRIKHENGDIVNPMEQEELMNYLTEKTGFVIKKEQLLKKPEIVSLKNNILTLDTVYDLNKRIYRNVNVYEELGNGEYSWVTLESGYLTETNEEEQYLHKLSNEKERLYAISYILIDFKTSLSIKTNWIFIESDKNGNTRFLEKEKIDKLELSFL